MPELPEVETVVRALRPHLVGRRIVSARFSCPRILRGQPEAMKAGVEGRRVTSVSRFGKHIVIALDEGASYLAVHLGMTGRLLIARKPGPYTHAQFRLDKGLMIYDDPRQFGRIEVGERPPLRIQKLGPEPLEVEAPDLVELLRGRQAMVKPLLLNQRFLRGLGNIYTDEALFRAGIHPRAVASQLSRRRALRLHTAIVDVLSAAIEQGGSSVSDYVDAEGRKGFFQFSHLVYQKTGQPCTKCGALIRRTLVAQRGTHFCPRCQRP